MKRPWSPLGALIAAVLLAIPGAGAKRFDILVNATATEEYLEKANRLEYQTYHFVKGKFWGGLKRDRGLEETQFQELAESLSLTLEKRRMFPEPQKSRGDLMIMISWGQTSLDPNYQDLQGLSGASDPSSPASGQAGRGGRFVATRESGRPTAAAAVNLNSADSDAVRSSGSGSRRSRNRALLGLQRELESANAFGYSKDQALWDALDEERYFVVLNAFDYQHLLEKKELKQVWSVRYNTRARGIGFQAAFESMNNAVGGVIGLNSNDIIVVKGDTSGKVTLGELELIELND